MSVDFGPETALRSWALAEQEHDIMAAGSVKLTYRLVGCRVEGMLSGAGKATVEARERGNVLAASATRSARGAEEQFSLELPATVYDGHLHNISLVAASGASSFAGESLNFLGDPALRDVAGRLKRVGEIALSEARQSSVRGEITEYGARLFDISGAYDGGWCGPSVLFQMSAPAGLAGLDFVFRISDRYPAKALNFLFKAGGQPALSFSLPHGSPVRAQFGCDVRESAVARCIIYCDETAQCGSPPDANVFQIAPIGLLAAD